MEQTHSLSSTLIGLNEMVDVSFESELNALVVVAHPDDETLWVGGLMLMCLHWRWRVVSICRGSDTVRSPKFFRALKTYGASGRIADLDDGPEQTPLDNDSVESTISSLADNDRFDLIITHSPEGEYTRHRRHEETAVAVTDLWQRRSLQAKELWYFAYSDCHRKQLPKAIENAHLSITLPDEIWNRKRNIIENIYGFSPNTWEHRTTPSVEAFWRFRSRSEVKLRQTSMAGTS